VVGVATSCAAAIQRLDTATGEPVLAELWREPVNLGQRDLFLGPGGRALVPSEGPYELIKTDKTGASPGYDVRDSRGRTWSVKLGIEAQPEVVTSRILWAIGFHQEPLYYVEDWRFQPGTAAPTPAARFRLERESKDVIGDWSWRQNPFVGTLPFSALVVTNVLLNNWDWKTNNNKIYAAQEPGGQVRREYVVRDLGAALGGTRTYPVWLQWTRVRGVLQGTKNDIDDFESHGFIKRVDGERISFEYRGIHGDLLRTIGTKDVVWTCKLLARLSDAQWDDAFRAGGYTGAERARYIAHIKRKIGEGLALENPTVEARSSNAIE
jgi:hypothetical protein